MNMKKVVRLAATLSCPTVAVFASALLGSLVPGRDGKLFAVLLVVVLAGVFGLCGGLGVRFTWGCVVCSVFCIIFVVCRLGWDPLGWYMEEGRSRALPGAWRIAWSCGVGVAAIFALAPARCLFLRTGSLFGVGCWLLVATLVGAAQMNASFLVLWLNGVLGFGDGSSVGVCVLDVLGWLIAYVVGPIFSAWLFFVSGARAPRAGGVGGGW